MKRSKRRSKFKRKVRKHIRKLKALIKDYSKLRDSYRTTERRMDRDLPVVKNNIAECDRVIHEWEADIRELEERLVKMKLVRGT